MTTTNTTTDLFASIAADADAVAAVAATAAKTTRRRAKVAATISADAADAAATTHARRVGRDTVSAALAADAPLHADRIGSLVWWTTKTDTITADPLSLWGAFDAADAVGGLGLAAAVTAPSTPATAIRRAMSRRQQGLAAEGLRWHDLGADNSGNVVVALGAEDGDANAADWQARAVLVLTVQPDGGVNVPPCSGVIREAVDALLARYQIERSLLTAADVTRLLTSLLLDRLDGVRVKAGGGVYFVPRTTRREGRDVDDVDAVLAPYAAAFTVAGIEIMRLDVGGEQRGAMARQASRSLVDDVTRLLDEARDAEARAVAAFASGESSKAPRFDAQEKRIAEVQAIADRAESLRLLLGDLVADVSDAVALATKASKATQGMLALIHA